MPTELTGSERQIPRPTRAAIDPRRVKIPLREKLPTPFRVDEGEVGIKDALPTTADGGSRVRGGRVGGVEEGGPFLGDECGGAG